VSEFSVSIKPSARRTNAAVGALVNRFGSNKRFDTRDDAAWWADGLSARGESRVWIRAANPNDRSDADAYLVGRRRSRAGRTAGTADRGGEQASLAAEFVDPGSRLADVTAV
jgi:hypothetical protein